MKPHHLCLLISLCFTPSVFADKDEKHKTQAEELAEEQDNLSADVQQLVIEQTHPKVIELLGEVEDIMDEVVELLAEADTGGKTLAAQTEIIEKIHAAAKERQQQQGSGESGSAMMDMMERMMGKKPGEGEHKGKGEGEGGEPGDEAGQGNGGLSDAGNEASGGNATGTGEIRRVPKASGTAGADIPEEFRKAFDAYNRGLESTTR
jgi:hypothetical protein